MHHTEVGLLSQALLQTISSPLTSPYCFTNWIQTLWIVSYSKTFKGHIPLLYFVDNVLYNNNINNDWLSLNKLNSCDLLVFTIMQKN